MGVSMEKRSFEFLNDDRRAHIRFAVKFLLHFFAVMLVMYCGAVVFAVLEDPEVMFPGDYEENTRHNSSGDANNGTQRDDGEFWERKTDGEFWEIMKLKYNVTLGLHLQQQFHDDMHAYFSPTVNNSQLLYDDAGGDLLYVDEHEPTTRHYVIMKWFYFVTIATTTVGYGDVTPKSDAGRLFYIFFSVVGIALMMSFLKSCGCILTGVNKRVYHFIKRHVVRKHDIVSDELVSVILMMTFFFLFMLLVVWHDQALADVKGESRIECFYFWLVTFTTVGFGDFILPLHVEMDHLYEMLFYRLFGLSFLAGIIESIQTYVKFRNKVIARNSTKRITKIKHKLLQKKEAPSFLV